MQLQRLTYDHGRGWSAPLPIALDSEQTLVLVFAARECESDSGVFDALARAFPRSVIAGVSTAGEIAGAEVRDASFSVAVVRFEHGTLHAAGTSVYGSDDSFDAGVRLAAQLPATGLRAVFVLCDGLRVNGTRLVAGLAGALPAGVTLSGGLAGDGHRFARTWVLAGGRPAVGQVSAVGFYGERLRIGLGCDGGWSDFGPERHITRAQGHVLYELDGEPALDLYKTYLGERAAGLPGSALLFPLAVRRADRGSAGGEPLVRTVLAVDEAARSMTFAGDLPQGGVARLMRANPDRLVASAGQAARRAMQPLATPGAVLLLSVSCVGRRLVLGERTEEELESVLAAAGPAATHLGFYSYGEIAPAPGGGASELHNQTMAVTAIAEV
jgi:hypothetical protein